MTTLPPPPQKNNENLSLTVTPNAQIQEMKKVIPKLSYQALTPDFRQDNILVSINCQNYYKQRVKKKKLMEQRKKKLCVLWYAYRVWLFTLLMAAKGEQRYFGYGRCTQMHVDLTKSKNTKLEKW